MSDQLTPVETTPSAQPQQPTDATIIFDIDKSWLNIAKRLQQIAARGRQRGISLITMAIFTEIDGDGKAIALQYPAPAISDLLSLEPRGLNDMFCEKLNRLRK